MKKKVVPFIKSNKTISSTSLRIQSVYNILGDAEKRIADLLKKNPRDIIHLSITELAERSRVSEATVVRFARKLGFKGYQDLKITFAQEMITPLQSIHEEITETDKIPEVLNKIFQSIIQTLYHTRDVLDMEQVEKAAEAILRARKILVFGLGNSAPVAMDAQHKFLRAGVDCAAYCDNHMQVIVASHLCPEDVVIGISHSGSSRDIVEAMQIAKECDATTICVTNYGKSPVLKYSDIHLFTASQETRFRILALASRIAQLGIIDTLYVYVALRKKEKGYDAIKRIERALQCKKF
jgi:RpiR family transcriptional regulator, carbohydrate utilization regulator